MKEYFNLKKDCISRRYFLTHVSSNKIQILSGRSKTMHFKLGKPLEIALATVPVPPPKSTKEIEFWNQQFRDQLRVSSHSPIEKFPILIFCQIIPIIFPMSRFKGVRSPFETTNSRHSMPLIQQFHSYQAP